MVYRHPWLWALGSGVIAAVAVGVIDALFDEWTVGTILTMLVVGGAVFVGVGAVRSRLWDRRKR